MHYFVDVHFTYDIKTVVIIIWIHLIKLLKYCYGLIDIFVNGSWHCWYFNEVLHLSVHSIPSPEMYLNSCCLATLRICCCLPLRRVCVSLRNVQSFDLYFLRHTNPPKKWC